MIKEACVETLEEAILAEKNGADRIELCSRLDLDGLTPSEDLLREVSEKLSIPIKVMIRNREGGFIYDENDFQAMVADIEMCRKYNPESLVFGALKRDRSIDLEMCKRICQVAQPMMVCFHKAIDLCPAPIEEILRLKKISNINSVLTSGGEQTALEGKQKIRRLLCLQNANFKVIVAGKVTSKNLDDLHQVIGAEEYHGRKIVAKK
jgi:copper homeostasis protein